MMRGGAKYTIADEMSEVTDAKSFEENTTCLFVSAHGETDTTQVMIIPENTFIVFTGASGFVSYGLSDKFSWLTQGSTKEKYYSGIYDEFVDKNESKRRFRKSSHVYIPGDILLTHYVSFKSDTQEFWTKGVFECPIEPDTSIEVSHKYWLPYVLEVIDLDSNNKLPESIKECVKDEMKESWERLKGMSFAEKVREYNNNKVFFDEPRKWFSDISKVIEFTDMYLFSSPKNLYKEKYISTLAELLSEVNPTSTHKYRFIIVSGCRSPSNFLGTKRSPMDEAKNKNNWANNPLFTPNPLFLKKVYSNAPKSIIFARRFSFSAKPILKNTCTVDDTTPMNLRNVLQAYINFNQKIKGTNNSSTYENMGVLGKFPKEWGYIIMMSIFFEDLDEPTGIKYRYEIQDIDLGVFIKFLDKSFERFPLLEDETPELQRERQVFKALLDSIKSSFGLFLKGIHMDTPNETAELKTLGSKIYSMAHGKNLIFPTKNNIPSIVSAQKNYLETADLPTLNVKTRVMGQQFMNVKNNMKTISSKKVTPAPAPEPTSTKPTTTKPNNRTKKILNWYVSRKSGSESNLNKAMMREWRALRTSMTPANRNAQNKLIKSMKRNLTRKRY